MTGVAEGVCSSLREAEEAELEAEEEDEAEGVDEAEGGVDESSWKI